MCLSRDNQPRKNNIMIKINTLISQAQAGILKIKTTTTDFKKAVSDGCTGVPDFEFTECCVYHDIAYDNGMSRFKADLDLFLCMRNTLITNNKNKGLKRLLPYVFFIGVRIFGKNHFKKNKNG